MTVKPVPGPTDIVPQPHIIRLMDGGELTIVTNVPNTSAGIRDLAKSAQMYGGWGSLHRLGAPLRNGRYAGYYGISSRLDGSRPAISLAAQCTRGATVLRLHTMTLLSRPGNPYANEYALLFVETHSVRGLIARGIAMTNRVTSCELASRRLTARQRSYGLALADQIAGAIHEAVFAGASNAFPFPLWSQKEITVAVVQRMPRAVNAIEIVDAARAAGARLTGLEPTYVVRRDLVWRDSSSGAPSRVATAWHRGRRVWWPHQLTRSEALAGYDQAHP